MQQMATLNKGACDAVRDLEVHGATDVTGFGLMGHGCEMAEGAGLCLQLRAADLPVLPGAIDLVRSGVLSGGCTRGKAFYGPRVKVEPNIEQALVDLVFDAETSGGLMLAVPASIADKVVRRLKDAGVTCHACIGQFAPRAAGGPSVTLA
jgi:selenide,water dikinase